MLKQNLKPIVHARVRKNQGTLFIMAMSALRQGASGGIGKFILFGFLVLAAGGLVFTDVGGFFRGGVGSMNVAKIGDDTISIYDFDRTARTTLNQINMSADQAYQMGYINQILQNEVRSLILANAAKDSGLQLSRSKVANEIRDLIKPMADQQGISIEEMLDQILNAQRISERQLVDDMNKQLSIDILSYGLKGAFTQPSEVLADDMAEFFSQTRDIEYVLVKYEDFAKEVAEPTEDDLNAQYQATKERFAIPEKRKIKLITLNLADIEATTEVTEEEIRSEYDNNIELFSHPETRQIEQAIIEDKEQAQKVFDLVNTGTELKKAVNDVLGNTTSYIPANEVDESNLLDELADALFEAEEGPIEPVKTVLGYHVMILDVVEPYVDVFEDVKDDIRKEILEVRVADARFELANSLDDLLAGGASPEEVKEQLSVDVIDVAPFSLNGVTADNTPVLSDLAEDRASIISEAFELYEGESSQVLQLANDKMGAVYLSSITPKSYQALDDVAETVKQEWINDQKRQLATEYVANALTELKDAAEPTLSLLEKQVEQAVALSRSVAPQAPVTPQALDDIFQKSVGEVFSFDAKEGLVIASVKDYKFGDIGEELKASISTRLDTELENEGFTLYIDEQQSKYNAIINQRLLEQTYAPTR